MSDPGQRSSPHAGTARGCPGARLHPFHRRIGGCVLERADPSGGDIADVAGECRELAQPVWDLEWLVTLPVSLPTSAWGEIVERTLLNSAGLLGLWPFLSVVAWESGYRFAAPILRTPQRPWPSYSSRQQFGQSLTEPAPTGEPAQAAQLSSDGFTDRRWCFYLAMSAGYRAAATWWNGRRGSRVGCFGCRLVRCRGCGRDTAGDCGVVAGS